MQVTNRFGIENPRIRGGYNASIRLSVLTYLQTDSDEGVSRRYHVGGNPLSNADPTGELLINPITVGAVIGGVAGAIQAANQNGGWTLNNTWAISVGTTIGVAAGAIPGFAPVKWGWATATGIGAVAAGAGNAVNQLAGNDPFSWCQIGVQSAFGAVGGVAGWGAGLLGSLGYLNAYQAVSSLATAGLVQSALAQGTTYGLRAQAASQALNLSVPTSLGGFNPSKATCGCSF